MFVGNEILDIILTLIVITLSHCRNTILAFSFTLTKALNEKNQGRVYISTSIILLTREIMVVGV